MVRVKIIERADEGIGLYNRCGGEPPLDRGGLCALRVEIRETWGGRPPVIYGIRVY